MENSRSLTDAGAPCPTLMARPYFCDVHLLVSDRYPGGFGQKCFTLPPAAAQELGRQLLNAASLALDSREQRDRIEAYSAQCASMDNEFQAGLDLADRVFPKKEGTC